MLHIITMNIIKWDTYPKSQKKPINNSDIFIFERNRLGNNIVTKNGIQFGPYLYRNIQNNVLVASWKKPSINKQLYYGYEIGTNTDALVYYKTH
jgi:hypothetical protein